mmetsp:Transcript_85758/g.149556  ORF Transcript_85758/g.149556 Transcript_85758/m.149556 type:complete len:90 (+) Transcript_85758:26-295(+)
MQKDMNMNGISIHLSLRPSILTYQHKKDKNKCGSFWPNQTPSTFTWDLDAVHSNDQERNLCQQIKRQEELRNQYRYVRRKSFGNPRSVE